MTEPDFRALCAELLDCDDGAIFGTDLIARARAALAQPEPVAPTDEEIDDISDGTTWYGSPSRFGREVARAAIALDRARFGRPAIEPQRPSDQELLRIYGVATPCYHVEEYKKELDFARAVWNLARR
jgi:hypothetical protein